MNDNEIKKDCEKCIHYDICLQWSTEPLDNADWCRHFKDKNLINCQQAKIDKCMNIICKKEDMEQQLAKERQQYYDELQQAKSEIELWKEECSSVGCENEWLKAHLKMQKSKAIKEFIERLNGEAEKVGIDREGDFVCTNDKIYDTVADWCKETSDNIVKEMVGDTK